MHYMLCVCIFRVYLCTDHYCVQFRTNFLCARIIKLQINDCAPCLFGLSNSTVFESGVVLCVRAPSNSKLNDCAQCLFCSSNETVFEFIQVFCVRASTNLDVMPCAQCSFDSSVFTAGSLETESSFSW